MKKLLVVLTVFLALSSCRYEEKMLGMAPAKVEYIYPVDNADNVSPDSSVVVVFSAPMDTVKTANEFSVDSKEGAVEGIYYWSDNDKHLEFVPTKPLKGGLKYEIVINQTAEDKDGNDLDREYTSVFYIDSDVVSPDVVSYSPQNAAIGVDQNSFIEIVFSESMDLNSAYDGVTISPSVQGSFNWSNNNTTLRIVPYSPLKKGSTYFATLNGSLRDIAGNGLRESTTFSFTIGSDFVSPLISEIRQNPGSVVLSENTVTGGIEKTGTFSIAFNELIDPETVADSVSFSPQCAHYITTTSTATQTILTIHPIDDLESEKTYQMTVAKSIADMNGNTLLREYRYKFLVDGEHSKRPQVLFMTHAALWSSMSSLPVSGQYWLSGQVQPVTPSNTLRIDDVYVIFSKTVKPATVNISIEATLGSVTPKITLPNNYWYDFNGSPYRIYRFSITNLASPATYKITVSGGSSGVYDSDGNTMKEDYIQYVRY